MTNEEIEEYRLEALRKYEEHLRDLEDPESMNWRQRFAPETCGCHEAFHLASVLSAMVDEQLGEHPAVLDNPEWYRLAAKASYALAELYQAIGQEHA